MTTTTVRNPEGLTDATSRCWAASPQRAVFGLRYQTTSAHLPVRPDGTFVNIGLLLDMAASGYGDRVAFCDREGQITYTELAKEANGGAALITSRRAGHVVFIGRCGLALPTLLFAATYAQVPFVPLNYRLSAGTLAALIAGLDRPFLVCDDDYAEILDSPHQAMTSTDYRALACATQGARDAPGSSANPAVMLYTSGTTARPKAVRLSHENLTSYIVSTVEFGSAEADSASLVTVPPYHIAGVGSVLSNLYAGRRAVYLPDFEPQAWLDAVRQHSVTSAMLVPTMLARIVDTLGENAARTPTLQQITYGGARMPAPLLTRALRLFPDTGFCNAYGLTETSSTVALLGPDEHRAALASTDPLVRARLGSAGRPVPGIEVCIRDDTGTEVAVGTVGRLFVRGAQVAREYEGIGSCLDAEGWFDTRDLACVDAEGYLFLRGRDDDTIIRGGENIAPAEIEDVLLTHPAVRDVAVLGLPDDEWGERIVAVIVPVEGNVADDQELRAYVRARLRGSRTPDEVVWRTTDLPHTPTGKLLRRQLRDELVDAC
jgi:acyl-CoA synthetase (AMP-forming)/AMP-acid ligase II